MPATEFFKGRKDLAATSFSDIFSEQSVQYNLHYASELSVPNVKNTFHGTESLSYLGPKIWDLVLKEPKELSSISTFKKPIKSGSLKITLVDYVKNTFKISVLFDTFPDILEFFKYLCFRS